MPVISLAIQKGGSGKTTTAINLAAALRQMGKQVLLVDMDPQANLTQALGYQGDLPASTYTLLLDKAVGKKVTGYDILLQNEGLHLLPASLDLAFAELELVSIYGREHLLRNLLIPMLKDYDFVLIDCPPAVGMLTVNALVASSAVVVPLQAEFLPLRGLKSFHTHFETIRDSLNQELSLLGIVLTRFDSRMKMHQGICEQLQTEFPGLLFETKISPNIALAQAQEKGMDIFNYDRTAKGAMDYLQLADEMLARLAV